MSNEMERIAELLDRVRDAEAERDAARGLAEGWRVAFESASDGWSADVRKLAEADADKEAAIAKEREACALIADAAHANEARKIAAAIRARSEGDQWWAE